MKQLSFKVKMFAIFITIIFITIVTSYFSANYYISSYVHENDTKDIKAKVNLIKDKLVEDINNKIILAENLNFGLTAIKSTKEKTGFHDIVKVVSDLAFTTEGSIDDKNKAQSYIDQVEKAEAPAVV